MKLKMHIAPNVPSVPSGCGEPPSAPANPPSPASTALGELEEHIEHLFASCFGPPPGQPLLECPPGPFIPDVDVRDRGREIVISADLPGLGKEDIELALTPQALILRGEKQAGTEEHGAVYSTRERSCGPFERHVPLPPDAHFEQTRARVKNGVLEVTLRRNSVSAQPRRRLAVQ